MSTHPSVLLVGGTGRTGHRVLDQLLSAGIHVRAILRSVQKLSASSVKNPNLTVIEADLFSLSAGELQHHIQGCDAVISCLGHTLTLKGLFGPPRDLVTGITMRLSQAVEVLQPAKPVRFILLSSVSVNHPGRSEACRGVFEKAVLWMIRGLLPPARDNQQAANFLYDIIGLDHPFLQWTVIRPDTLLDGGATDYRLQEGLVNSLFAPGRTSMANIAHFMGDLVTEPETWHAWKGKLPVIVNTTASSI